MRISKGNVLRGILSSCLIKIAGWEPCGPCSHRRTPKRSAFRIVVLGSRPGRRFLFLAGKASNATNPCPRMAYYHVAIGPKEPETSFKKKTSAPTKRAPPLNRMARAFLSGRAPYGGSLKITGGGDGNSIRSLGFWCTFAAHMARCWRYTKRERRQAASK